MVAVLGWLQVSTRCCQLPVLKVDAGLSKMLRPLPDFCTARRSTSPAPDLVPTKNEPSHLVKILLAPVNEFGFIQTLIVRANMPSKALALPISILLVEPSKLPLPSIWPAPAAVEVIVPSTALLVESLAVRLVPFGRCQT